MILVSACLLGISCRYDGKSNSNSDLIELFGLGEKFIPICPEVFGGLRIPRVPCEICGNKVVDREEEDRTKEFSDGAEIALKIAKNCDAKYAILKSRSPSCGYGKIYDGTFAHNLIDGNGITAELLAKNGVIIANEDNFRDIIPELNAKVD